MTRTRTAQRMDPDGQTLAERMSAQRDRHETALWLVPTLTVAALFAAAFVR